MESAGERERNVRWLAGPESYPHRPDRVEHIEMPISDVFPAELNAYKLKEPVKYDFRNCSTVPVCEHACREQVRLHRRPAPDTCLGVVPA